MVAEAGVHRAITVAAALLSYDLAVRGTWIGWLLNGRRKESVLRAWLRRDSTALVSASAPPAR